MKKITLLFFALFTVASFSQVTVWSDDFNDEDISDWTTTDSDGDGINWGDISAVGDGMGGFVTPISLISRSWQGTPLTPDNWVVSPAIDLSTATAPISLNWITQVAAQSWDQEKYSVHVGTSDDISVLVNATASMTEVLGDAGDTGTPTPHTLDLSALAGETTVYVAFRHWDCTDQDFISIDDVTVEAQSLSIEEFTANTFNHSYNKNTDKLTLESSSVPFNNVDIFNIIGQRVINQTLTQSKEVIDMSNLKDGIYLVKVISQGQIQTIKILKQ